jgi:Recombinase
VLRVECTKCARKGRGVRRLLREIRPQRQSDEMGARAAGRAAVQARVRNRALDLAPAIQELQAAGCESLRAIAAGLEERGIPAPRGGSWSAVQVARVLEAAAIPFDASVGAAEDTSNMLRLVQGLRNRSDIQLTTQLLGKRI